MRAAARDWISYLLCVLAGLGAVGWLTWSAVRSERNEREAKAHADLQEKVRLATWRMDSTLSLFLGPEAARPYSHYRSLRRGDPPSAASPLLTLDDPFVRLRFQFEGSQIASPSIPDPGAATAKLDLDSRRIDAARSRAEELRRRLAPSDLCTALAREGGALLTLEEVRALRQRTTPKGRLGPKSPFEVFEGRMIPFWHRGELLLVRQVWVGDRELLQGCWLDWTELREVLMSTIRDFLPHGELKAADQASAAKGEGRLATLPVVLDPGPPAALRDALPRSTVQALALAWGLGVAGTLAGWIILLRTTRASERRAALASAVTHELRTPLTTFRLTTELLAKGMVPEAEERQTLLETLRIEAERLDHIVKNVLAFARMEVGRGPNLEVLSLGGILERCAPRLRERARQGHLELEIVMQESDAAVPIRVDLLVVEQILLNLVDNAVKYGRPAPNAALDLTAESREGWVLLRVRDHGPGIPAADRGRLFHTRLQGGAGRSRTAPGLGLGLSLCARLARSLGGRLSLDDRITDGACFELRLPRAG